MAAQADAVVVPVALRGERLRALRAPLDPARVHVVPHVVRAFAEGSRAAAGEHALVVVAAGSGEGRRGRDGRVRAGGPAARRGRRRPAARRAAARAGRRALRRARVGDELAGLRPAPRWRSSPRARPRPSAWPRPRRWPPASPWWPPRSARWPSWSARRARGARRRRRARGRRARPLGDAEAGARRAAARPRAPPPDGSSRGCCARSTGRAGSSGRLGLRRRALPRSAYGTG